MQFEFTQLFAGKLVEVAARGLAMSLETDQSCRLRHEEAGGPAPARSRGAVIKASKSGVGIVLRVAGAEG